MSTAKDCIRAGEAVLGIEFGSTRIKAVLIDETHSPIASGDHAWENRLEGGYWTYSLEDIWGGLRSAYASLAADVKEKYGEDLRRVKAMGISAMMHGYLAFDQAGKLLVPFRTWRNSTTGAASKELTELFSFHIPERWSISHLRQAMLNKEPHVPQIDFVTTLAGYVHWQLTGEKVLGVGDASGMFPIADGTCQYDPDMLKKWEALVAGEGLAKPLTEIFPKVLPAGCAAGCLTAEGAKLLDPSGLLEAGIPLCPPEGDAGTGMAATNSVKKRTGNVSAGTSIFAMVVMEKALSQEYDEIDLVTTPDGAPVAMVHANNCSSDIDAWARLFEEFAEAAGCPVDKNTLYGTLYRKALEGAADCAGLMSYGYVSGENITGLTEGRPLFVREPDTKMTLGSFMRTHIYSALGALGIGLEILTKEQVAIDALYGHGGMFKVPGVAQKFLAGAVNAPVSVMKTAGEGGPWGMALLAAYMARKDEGEMLGSYLESKVFAGSEASVIAPDEETKAGFAAFLARYKKGIAVEKCAVETL